VAAAAGGVRDVGEEVSQQITYRVEVYVTIPLSDDAQHADYPTLETATHGCFKREIERNMLATLSRFEHEVTNLELMDFTVEDE
jgi:hypothetical protein